MNISEFFIIILLTVFIFLFIKFKNYELVHVKSDIDNQYYLVRDVIDKQEGANLLARIRQNINTLIVHLNKNIHDKNYEKYIPYINQLTRRIKNSVINESLENSIYTSYSVNKGEQIVFCIRSRSDTGQLHSLNLMMYVALHEIAHVGCPENGHTPLFKDIFYFFTKVGISIGIYNKIDFSGQPHEYCGMTITDSII